MTRSQRHITPDPGDGSPTAAPLAHLPRWAILARCRRPWARLRMMRWPIFPSRSEIDNSLPENVDRATSLLSRAMGPVLLLPALGGVIWAIGHWLA